MNRSFVPKISTVFLFLLLCTGFTLSKVHYITPSQDGPCPQNSSCFTLSQFAANSSNYYNDNEISLSFLPGNHTLNGEISVSHKEYFAMEKTPQLNGSVYIKCLSSLGKFVVSNTTAVLIKNLHFIGCGGNTVVETEQVIVKNSIFQGVQSGETVLVLSEVASASIVESEFFSNVHSKRFKPEHKINDFSTDQDILEFVYLNRNTSLTIGGALSANLSNVSIISSNFVDNRADIGGALVAHNSSIHISTSTFSNNSAIFGGVMVTSGCSVDVINGSIFSENAAELSAGVMMMYGDNLTISDCTFNNNSAEYEAGVLTTFNMSSLIVSLCEFTNNRAVRGSGGVMKTLGESTVTITKSIFSRNFAIEGGVLKTLNRSFLVIISSVFNSNSVLELGGVIRATDDSSFDIKSCTFNNNSVTKGFGGGVACTTEKSSFIITNSSFVNNSVLLDGGGGGGVVTTFHSSRFTITSCHFSNNSAPQGGVIRAVTELSSFNIVNSTFVNNRATLSGGVILTLRKSSVIIINCTFSNNKAIRYGGVLKSSDESRFNITNSTFSSNRANNGGTVSSGGSTLLNISGSNFTNSSVSGTGGVIWCSEGGYLSADKSKFMLNHAESYGGVMFSVGCSIHFSNSEFVNNTGSLYTFSSNLTFSGNTKLENNTKPLAVRNSDDRQEGGAITSFQSDLTFTGLCHLLNNQAENGGAILAIESKIIIYGQTILKNNTAVKNSKGGGMFLQQSTMEVKGNCLLSHNHALNGGGIHATSSSISVLQPGVLEFLKNRAENGSGIYLETNPKLYTLKRSPLYTYEYTDEDLLIFTENHANCYGGAVYVDDDSNTASCSNVECFIQSLALHQINDSEINTVNMLFTGNTAMKLGPNIYGGLLDRCRPSPFAEVYLKYSYTAHYSGVAYLRDISFTYINSDALASGPVRACFCNVDHKPDCSYQPPAIRVKKGKGFNVALVAVDQVNHTVEANLFSYLSSFDGGLGEGQQTQSVKENCTNLTFNVYSPQEFETLNLYPDGPCGGARISTSYVTIQFINCTCPIGFEPQDQDVSASRCDCNCDTQLSPHITNCSSATGFLLREGTRSWIDYVNSTDPPGFLIQANCPYDYCFKPTDTVGVNFNLPKGADSQCAYNRTGILCGACKEDLSLSLASSRCLQCHRYWVAVLITILLSAIVAGILMVTVLLALNMTVAVGLINGFIFYANILQGGSTVFFPSSEPSFPSVFIAWLNFDIGIDVCFIDGLDAYSKAWLQLAFPVYIISLVAMVIIVSEYSPRFSRLIARKDPVATLATLILLSYAKLLSTTITALSFAVLHYPDGSQQIVWLSDGNVPYFQGKHTALGLVAVLIILIGLPYTILLFLWQWIVRAPKWKFSKWTRNTKLHAIITTYHAPHNSKHRYWTGLLLLARVVFYVISSLTVSAKPQTILLVIILFVGCLLLHKGIISQSVYKNSLVDILDTVLYFNLFALAVLSLYDFKDDTTKQTAIVYTSTIVTFILLIGAVIYHMTLLPISCKCTRKLRENAPQTRHELKERLLDPLQQEKPEVTYSVIELPKQKVQRLPLDALLEVKGGMPKTIENETLTYQ